MITARQRRREAVLHHRTCQICLNSGIKSCGHARPSCCPPPGHRQRYLSAGRALRALIAGRRGSSGIFGLPPPLVKFLCPSCAVVGRIGGPTHAPTSAPPRIAIKTSTPPQIFGPSPSFFFVGIPDSSNLLPLQCVPFLLKRLSLPPSII